MRLFTAIELPAAVRDRLAEQSKVWKALCPSASWVRPENLHITLKFIGEFEDARANELREALTGASSVGVARLHPQGVVCFPHRGPVRVISAGIGGDTARIEASQKRLEEACARLGIPKENRAYHPHITLARARSPLRAEARQALAESWLRDLEQMDFEVTECVLVQSQLRRGGAVYTAIARFQL